MLSRLLRGALVVLLAFLMAGFGVCGAYGTFIGPIMPSGPQAHDGSLGPVALACGVAGLASAWIVWKCIAGLLRGLTDPDR